MHPDESIKKFADDTKVYISYYPTDAATAHHKLQESLDSLSVWCTQWCLQLNETKCCSMYFGRNNHAVSYSLNGHSLSRSFSIRDLGVTVNESGTVSEQCQNVASSARRLTGLIFRTFKSRKASVILPILKSIIRPIVEYATPVWNPSLQKDITEIEKVQRQVTRYVHRRST